MSLLLWKLTQAPRRRRTKYKAFERAYREAKEDKKKSKNFSLTDAIVKEEMITMKITKALADASILVVEYKTLGITENLIPLRHIYEMVKDMEKERLLLQKIRQMNHNEECRRNSYVMDHMRENLLLKNIFRMKMKSKRSSKEMAMNAMRLEREKGFLDSAKNDVDQALEYDADDNDDEEETAVNDSGFLSWVDRICGMEPQMPLFPSTVTNGGQYDGEDNDDILSQRLAKLKIRP